MLKKRFFWIMIGLWILTAVFLIIGLSLLGTSAKNISTAEVTNGFSYLNNDYEGTVGNVLAPDFVKNHSNNFGNSTMLKEARVLQAGVAISVIIVPIVAGTSGLYTAFYFTRANKVWREHLPKNYVPKSRQRILEQENKNNTSNQIKK